MTSPNLNEAHALASVKALAWSALDSLAGPECERACERWLAPQCDWHVSHPIETLTTAEAVAADYFAPLRRAFPDLERRSDIFLGGHWDGSIAGGAGWWVTCTGHYFGTFRADWLGIAPTGKLATLRFGEFYRVADGRIAEARILLDIVDLARQAGFPLLPPSSGADLLVPGPRLHNGLLLGATEPALGQRSMAQVMSMIFALRRFDQSDLQSMDMASHWHPDMMWYGPCGIGTARGVTGFQRHHQAPFLRAFPDRVGGNHRVRLAEGPFVATTGWPSVRATHRDDYLGVPATNKAIEMRVMDWWACEPTGLTENWVLIDLPHLMLQMGVDLLGRLNTEF